MNGSLTRDTGAVPEDMLLVIEEYWIVETTGRRVVVYRHPEGQTYRDRMSAPSSGTVAPLASPDVVVRVADIFG